MLGMAAIPPVPGLARTAPAGRAAGAPSPAHNICEREMIRAARTFNVPVNILYAVGLTETGRRGSLQPYAMNIEGKAFFAASPREAIARLDAERARGVKLIDLGCMQINHIGDTTALRWK